jgi:hypothetical protein
MTAIDLIALFAKLLARAKELNLIGAFLVSDIALCLLITSIE